MIPSAKDFLGIIQPNETNIYKLGKIDPSYVSGKPKIVFDGEAITSLKKYPCLGSYTPTANDRVLLLKVANSYVVLGKIV